MLDSTSAAGRSDEPSSGVTVFGDLRVTGALTADGRLQIAQSAIRIKLPAACPQKQFVEAGGLMSYGPDFDDLARRSAAYVDKILKGAKPADLPVEQPTKFELVLNLKTARQLGLSISRDFLATVDEVIQ